MENSTEREKLIERIRKVKALADNAGSTGEGVAAALAFQRLLEKNGMTESEIEIAEETEEEVCEPEVLERGRIYNWEKLLGSTIAKHFRCICVTTRYRNSHSVLKFVGHDNDSKIAVDAFSSIRDAAERLWKKYCKTHSRDDKETWLVGFIRGLNDAFKEQEASSTFAIIVTVPEDVQNAVSNFKQRSVRMQYNRDSGALRDGYEKGNNVGKGDRIAEGY